MILLYILTSILEFSAQNGNGEVLLIKGSKDDDEPEEDDIEERVVGGDGNVHNITPPLQTDDLVHIDETNENVIKVLSVPLAGTLLLATEPAFSTVTAVLTKGDVLGNTSGSVESSHKAYIPLETYLFVFAHQ